MYEHNVEKEMVCKREENARKKRSWGDQKGRSKKPRAEGNSRGIQNQNRFNNIKNPQNSNLVMATERVTWNRTGPKPLETILEQEPFATGSKPPEKTA